ncbi:hypothetical protein ACFLT1_02645 [Bacteroidota bacterium]
MKTRISYLAVISIIIVIVSIFLPWVEATSSANISGYSSEYSTGEISGINFADGT